MDLRKLKHDIKQKTISSEDLDALIYFLKQNLKDDISEDDIEYLQLYKILIDKGRMIKNNSIMITEWREIGDATYHKLKNIISDLEYLRIIAFREEAIGGLIWFQLVDKSKYFAFLFDSVDQIVERINIDQDAIADNLPLEEVQLERRKLIIQRIDPDLAILESWLINGSPKDFESAVTKLFWIYGISSVHVGDEYEQATLTNRRSKYVKSSVSLDIVVDLREPSELILCQCSTDWKDSKITELANISYELYNYFKSNSDVLTLHSVIVTRVNKAQIQESINQASKTGINVIDLETLLQMLGNIKNSKYRPFRDFIS